jgi:ATP-dependent Zn protease
MHTRDYSDETSRVIDEEVERILREQEDRALRILREHREGLSKVAAALLEKETIDGEEVGRLVDGRPAPVDAVGAVVDETPSNGAVAREQITDST